MPCALAPGTINDGEACGAERLCINVRYVAGDKPGDARTFARACDDLRRNVVFRVNDDPGEFAPRDFDDRRGHGFVVEDDIRGLQRPAGP